MTPVETPNVSRHDRSALHRRPAACVVVTAPITVEAFLRGHLKAMAEEFNVTLAGNFGATGGIDALPVGVKCKSFRLIRGIHPVQDLICLIQLMLWFRTEHFDLVHSYTPKAGLLAMLAAYVAGIPLRVHTFTGQVWATLPGWRRAILRGLDWWIATASTTVLADSRSQLEFLRREGVLRQCDGGVIGSGSISGVDLERFRPRDTQRRSLRAAMGLENRTFLFGYLGRLKRDKGVWDLARAFRIVAERYPEAALALVGPDEEGLRVLIENALGEFGSRVCFVGWTREPELYLASFDVLCLPSYREGFGSVIIEAGACGVPAVASNIYGISDAVVDGVTGWLHRAGDVQELGDLMQRVMRDRSELERRGTAAQQRAYREFSGEAATEGLMEFYRKHLLQEDRRDESDL